jgi:hypothetical protein
MPSIRDRTFGYGKRSYFAPPCNYIVFILMAFGHSAPPYQDFPVAGVPLNALFLLAIFLDTTHKDLIHS